MKTRAASAGTLPSPLYCWTESDSGRPDSVGRALPEARFMAFGLRDARMSEVPSVAVGQAWSPAAHPAALEPQAHANVPAEQPSEERAGLTQSPAELSPLSRWLT